MLADEPFAEALRSLETCVSVNNNFCGKLVSSLKSPIKFDERFKVAGRFIRILKKKIDKYMSSI